MMQLLLGCRSWWHKNLSKCCRWLGGTKQMDPNLTNLTTILADDGSRNWTSFILVIIIIYQTVLSIMCTIRDQDSSWKQRLSSLIFFSTHVLIFSSTLLHEEGKPPPSFFCYYYYYNRGGNYCWGSNHLPQNMVST